MQSDSGHSCVKLTSSFDSVDHSILLNRLKHWLGISGSAWEGFSSYLSRKSLSVYTAKCRSSQLLHGVPQGSNLGDFLSILYILLFYHIFVSLPLLHKAILTMFSSVSTLNFQMFLKPIFYSLASDLEI